MNSETPKIPTVEEARAAVDAARVALDEAVRAKDALAVPGPTGDEATDLDALDEFDRQLRRAERLIAMRRERLASTETTLAAVESQALALAAKDAREALAKDVAQAERSVTRLSSSLANSGFLSFIRATAEEFRTFENAADALRSRGEHVEPLEDEAASFARLCAEVAKCDEDAASLLRAAAAVAEFVGKRPDRERERAERERQRQQAVEDRYRDECRRGEHGEEARQRVVAETLAQLRDTMYPSRSAVVASAVGSVAQREIEVMRANAGLPSEP